MIPPENFLTHSLSTHPRGAAVARILAAALQAVEPGQAVRRFFQRSANQLEIAGQVYALDEMKQIRILGLGKAAQGMIAPVAESLADLSPRILAIPKQAFSPPWPHTTVIPGGHPVPNENSLQTGAAALGFVSGLGPNDLLICLISGGGSALMTAPHPGLALPDLQTLTRQLLACGARVDEINILRRHLDQVKGGGLARAAQPAQVVGLILSDVIGNPLESIASGPTAPDPSDKAAAFGVLEKYGLTANVPTAILHSLEKAPETAKPGHGWWSRVQNVIAGSNALAAQSALRQAKAEGFPTRFLGDDWQGEARDVAQRLCAELRQTSSPICLVAGGETTVTLRGGGLGGRNQELALAAVPILAEAPDLMLITLATDGEDGPTNAAGAVVTTQTLARAQALGLNYPTFLDENNSNAFFAALQDLLMIGPSGTNVNDLSFLFRF